MSSLYVLEPPTFGKVILKTTLGELDIELWAKEAPRTCRNFVQLCLEDYYLNTIFHRVVKGFTVQGGDPSGTGFGGDSVYGKPFKDEFHSRLKFVRRGLVAMANGGKDDNGSQFFMTFAPTPELQNKHTIFGKVTGDTIFNLTRFEEIEVDKTDKPLFPPKIIKIEVVINPFTDIVPRIKEIVLKKLEAPEKPKVKARAIKNFQLLSFGDEALDDENELKEVEGLEKKTKSAFDLLPNLKTLRSADDDSAESNLNPTSGKRVAKNDLQLNYSDEERSCSTMKKKKKNLEGTKNETKDLLTGLSEHKKASEKIPRKGALREQQTLEMWTNFRASLKKYKEAAEETTKETESSSDDKSWMNHVFKCPVQEFRTAKDANTKDGTWYDITDPRNSINKRRQAAEPSDKEHAKSRDY